MESDKWNNGADACGVYDGDGGGGGGDDDGDAGEFYAA